MFKTSDLCDSLTEMQNNALTAMQMGKNVLVTGAAGTGKSHCINIFQEWTRTIGTLNVAITSTTGVSALLIKGVTLHSWAGIGLGEESAMVLAKKIQTNKKSRKKWESVDILIIDEISMMPPDLFDKLNQIAQIIRCNRRPFGGIQLILTGDFCQLGPVKCEKFCFEAECWSVCISKVYHFTEIIRQKDKSFQETLNNIRMGICTQKDRDLLETRLHQKPLDTRIKPTKLHSHKAKVEQINKTALQALKSKGAPSQLYVAKLVIENQNIVSLTDSQKERYTRLIQGSNQSSDILEVALGSQVMLICNLDLEKGLANGSRGIIIELSDQGPTVYFKSGLEEIIQPWTWTIDLTEYEGVLLMKKQIPLILADSVTIHKCVSADTLITTSNCGLKYIKDFSTTQGWAPLDTSLFTMNGIENTSKIYQGEEENSIILTTRMGYTLEGSHRHPILTINSKGVEEWKKLPDIQLGDFVVIRYGLKSERSSPIETSLFDVNSVICLKTYNIPKTIDKNLCYLIGLLIGDGSYNRSDNDYNIEYCSIDQELLDIYTKILQEQFNIEGKIYIRKTEENRQKFTKIYFCSKLIRKFFEWCGINYVTARQKSIPWTVLQNTLECQKMCIKGLFDTDGGCNNTSLHFTSSSFKLVCQVQSLLLNFGIISRISHFVKTNAWRVEITGAHARTYMKDIGFVVIKKQEKGMLLYGTINDSIKSNIGEIPNGRALIHQLRDEKYKKHNCTKSCKYITGKFGKLLSQIICHKSKLRYTHLKYIIDNMEDLEEFEAGKIILKYYNNKWFFDPVQNIDYSKCVMYDFEVPESHSFISNGIVSHNSQGATIDYLDVNLGNTIFEPGQSYTALSRVRELEGLFISDIDYSKIRVHPKVKQFYETHTEIPVQVLLENQLKKRKVN
jgi:ATP-dependent DNA helicase PIF1